MRLISSAFVFWLVMAAGTISAGERTSPGEEESADRTKPRVVNLDQAVRTLVAEAEPAWKAGKAFPRRVPDFAQTHEGELTNEELLRALGRTLHKVPPIDAYVKWQLLSYEPEFAPAPRARRQIQAVLEAMPALAEAPSVPTIDRPDRGGGRGGVPGYIFTGRQIAYVSDLEPVVGAGGEIGFNPTVSVISEGVLLKADGYVTIHRTEYVPIYRATAGRFNFNRKWVNRANQTTRRYRDALIDRVPGRAGERYAARLADLSQRLKAGDLSYEVTLAKLQADAQSLADAEGVSRRRLGQLARTTQAVGQVKKPIITELRVAPQEKRMYVDKHEVAVPTREVDGLIFRLKQAAR